MRFFEEFVTLSDKVTKFNFVRIAYLIAIAQSRLVIDRTIFNKTHECGAPPYLASKGPISLTRDTVCHCVLLRKYRYYNFDFSLGQSRCKCPHKKL